MIILILLIVTVGISSKYSKDRFNFNYELITKHNKIVAADVVPSNMKVYRYEECGYEVSYPYNYFVVLSGVHSPVTNPEYGMRLSLHSEDRRIIMDIDSVNKINYRDKYENYVEFIKYKHLNLSLDEENIVKHKPISIYRLKDEDYYFLFFENDEHIVQLSSNSKEFLKTIMITFRFI